MNKFKLILLVLFTMACGSHTTDIIETTVIEYRDPPYNAIGDIIYSENKYRDSVGRLPLTEGLTCTLYTVPNSTIQIVGAALTSQGNFVYKGNFDVANGSVSNGLPILPDGLKSVHKTYYILRCTGHLVVLEDGYHNFDVTSDDGANLYIGSGSIFINHDGLHGVSTKSGAKFLRKGITSFRLDYFQAAGNQALNVKVNGETIEAERFYR